MHHIFEAFMPAPQSHPSPAVILKSDGRDKSRAADSNPADPQGS
jgi:hypothetical protein